jgi:lysophospholipase L1-like esterase
MANIDGINATSSLVYSSLGDSLAAGVGTDNYTESYPYLLASKLGGAEQGIILRNHSLPGANTADLISNLLSRVINDNPDIITLLIGVNDIHNRISIRDFKNNYEQILSRLTKETKARIYVISIPFIGADSLMLPPYQTYFNYQTKRFNAVIQELAVKYQVSYIDLYTPTLVLFKEPGEHYSVDLFHPSAAGYKIWAQIIYDNIHK